MDKEIKLFLGVGSSPIHPQHLQIVDDSWIFIDLYVEDPKIVKMDARKLEYPDNSVSKIYNSHLLEHISMKEVLPTLKEWYRVLKPEGDLIINVPDLDFAIDQYVGLRDNPNFIPQSPVFNTKQKIMEIILGNQDHEGEFHKSAFTQVGLEQALQEAGFREIKVKKLYEAHEMTCLIAKAKK